MFPDIFLSLSVEKQAIIIYLSLMFFCTSFGAIVLHSIKRYLGGIQTRKIMAAQRALAFSTLGYTCYVGYQFGEGDFFELIAIIGNVSIVACGFQVIAASITVHPSRKLLMVYQAQIGILFTLFILFSFCTFIYPLPYVRPSVTLALAAACYLCGVLYRGYFWKQTNFGDKIVTLSFAYCVATTILPLSDRPGSTSHSVNGAIVLSQLPTMLGWFSGTLVAMISMHLHRIEELADKDWLTGLITERHFYDRVPDLIHLVNRKKGNACLAEVEVDQQSDLAKKYGREFRHLTIQALADIIKSNIRRTDVFARTSDNTIAIFMPFENIKTARVALRRINRRVSQTVLFTNNEPFTMTLSAGVYQLELDEEIDSAILRTHQALKTAQTEGGDQISEIELAASQIGSS